MIPALLRNGRIRWVRCSKGRRGRVTRAETTATIGSVRLRALFLQTRNLVEYLGELLLQQFEAFFIAGTQCGGQLGLAGFCRARLNRRMQFKWPHRNRLPRLRLHHSVSHSERGEFLQVCLGIGQLLPLLIEFLSQSLNA